VSEHEPFLAAVLADPGDPGPRLVYADWLDEGGDPRGAWLRLAVEPPKLAAITISRDGAIRELEGKPGGEPLLRLFACWCVRLSPLGIGGTVWTLLEDRSSREAVAVAELYACGLVSADRLGEAREDARRAEQRVWQVEGRYYTGARGAVRAARCVTHADAATAAADSANYSSYAATSADVSNWQEKLLAALLTYEPPPMP
jgi:uncharacterized protein (TIGR02996 family)